MSVHDCLVLGIEGSHAAGKTTLVHALVSHLRESGVHATATLEVARTSPFIEDIVLRGQGDFDAVAELDLFAGHIVELLRASRHQQVLVADKTFCNVIGYSRVVLPRKDRYLIEAMLGFARANSQLYDLVFFCQDQYSPQETTDRLRAKVAGREAVFREAVWRACQDTGVETVRLPRSLATFDRVDWILNEIHGRGLSSSW